jgi:hypothetical protein
VQNFSEDVEEVLLVISASGFDWVTAIARTEILAAETTQRRSQEDIVAAQLKIVQVVLDRFQ